MLNDGPMVSVVVPTRNRAAYLADALSSVMLSNYPTDRFEIIVVDNGSSDDTHRVIEEAQTRALGLGVHLTEVREERVGVNSARNAGIREAKGELVWLFDDDELAHTGSLSNLVQLMADELAGVGGPFHTSLNFGRVHGVCRRCSSTYKNGGSDVGSPGAEVRELLGGNALIRRAAFDAYGEFDPLLSGPGDDTEWFARARHAGATFIGGGDVCAVIHRLNPDDLSWGPLLRGNLRAAQSLAHARRLMGTRVGVVGDDLRLALTFLGHGVRRRCRVGVARGIGRLAIGAVSLGTLVRNWRQVDRSM